MPARAETRTVRPGACNEAAAPPRRRTLLAKILGILLLHVLLAGAAVVLLVDPLTRRTVQSSTTYATGTESSLASANVGLLRGDVVLRDLVVENPADFEGRLLELGSVHAKVELGSIVEDVLRLPEVVIEGLTLNVVQVGTRSNLMPIIERMRELGRTPPGEPPTRPEGDAGRQAVIERMVIRGLQVRATLRDVAIPGLDPLSVEDASFTFPELVLEDLGEPRTLGEWVGVVLEVAMGALEETDLPGVWRESLEEHLDAARERAVQEVREILEGIEVPGLEEGLPVDLEGAREGARRALEGVIRRGEGGG